MFFRNKVTTSGVNWQLVESFRNLEGLPRQKIIASLGNAWLPEDELKSMAKVLEIKLQAQSEMFSETSLPIPLSESAARWVDRIYRQIVRDGRFCHPQPVGHVGGAMAFSVPVESSSTRAGSAISEQVRIEGIEHENNALLGPLLPVKAAWESLAISQCLHEIGLSKRQIAAAAASVISRLVEPSSEHALVEWIPTTALPELLGDDVLGLDHKYFYRISDKLLKNQQRIESHLREHSQKIFGLDRTVILYDLTNTYFEGQALGNEKARRGNSKEKRHDRPLVVLGMVYDGSGFALAHKTFPGNTNDGNSLVEMVEDLKRVSMSVEGGDGERQLGFEEQNGGTKIKTLVVVDAGVATRGNLAMLKEAGFSYLVNDTRSKRSRYEDQFNDREKFRRLTGRDTQRRKAPVEVRMLREPAFDTEEQSDHEGGGDGSTLDHDTILLCRSQGRQAKEDAMFSKAEERFLKRAQKLDRRLKCGRLSKPKKIYEAIGRLKTQNSRVQRFYTIALREESNPREGLLCECKEAEIEQHRQLFGCYVLRTDRQDFEAEELWRVYIGLTQAEEGFRALKTDLGLRPNFHQKEHRVDGHIFITVIAFHLWRWIRHKLDSAGDNRDWVSVRRILRTHCYATLIVPCEKDRVYHIRKPGRPEEEQRQIYQSLGVNFSNLTKTTVKFDKPGQQ